MKFYSQPTSGRSPQPSELKITKVTDTELNFVVVVAESHPRHTDVNMSDQSWSKNSIISQEKTILV